LYAKDKTRNAIHGSDSDESAMRESRFFFSAMEQFKELV
jgi:nucleoside-diphosphate kinase